MLTRAVFGTFLLSIAGQLGKKTVLPSGFQEMDNAELSTMEILKKFGYPLESHEVQTEDGYLVILHRVPGGRDKRSAGSRGSRPPVYFQHGVACHSGVWVAMGPSRSLALQLADRGYDVWLGNIRGSLYSSHVRYTKDDSQFWDITWDEIGRRDMPAILDHILARTGHPRLYYVGHSMGGSLLGVLLSTRPEYNAKIEHAFGLAPAVFLGDCKSVAFRFFTIDVMTAFLRVAGPSVWLPGISELSRYTSRLCAVGSPIHTFCRIIEALFQGPTTELNPNLLALVIFNAPSETPTKCFVHIGQAIKTGTLRPFDEGPVKNMQLYNSPVPPDYNFSLVEAPMTVMASDEDYVVQPPGVQRFCKIARNCRFYKVPIRGFNHFDFFFGEHANEYVSNVILNCLEKKNTTGRNL